MSEKDTLYLIEIRIEHRELIYKIFCLVSFMGGFNKIRGCIYLKNENTKVIFVINKNDIFEIDPDTDTPSAPAKVTKIST